MGYRDTLREQFSAAEPGSKVTEEVGAALRGEGFTPDNTVVATSTCPDELNTSVTDFEETWGDAYQLGGLAGLPFVGASGVSSFLQHVDDDGNVFVIFASHVGVDEEGVVGQVNRDGMDQCTSACDSAVSAYMQLRANADYEPSGNDYQQGVVTDLVRKDIDKLRLQENALVMLPHLVYEYIRDEIDALFSPLGSFGQVALLGGIQINTPHGEEDYFLVKEFSIVSKKEVPV
jgi:hypothetical protein